MRFSVISLIFAGMVVVSASPGAHKLVVRDVDPACKDCAGVNKTDGPSYCCENSRLGPSVLPTKPPFPVLLEGYKRFGNLTARQFVNNTTWFNQTSNTYVYPYADGFQNDTSMVPIKGMEILTTGMRVDHFGGLNILAPSVTAFSQRSLPPSCLNNIDNNYNQYEVAKSFTVLSGPVTAWFAQPGQGIQYMLLNEIQNVTYLVQKGFLKAV